MEITMTNGIKILFPVRDIEEYKGIVRKLDHTRTNDTDLISCAKKIKEYCKTSYCENCVLYSNGRCVTQSEVKSKSYNDKHKSTLPSDWKV